MNPFCTILGPGILEQRNVKLDKNVQKANNVANSH